MLNFLLPTILLITQEPPKPPEANPQDVASIDSILKATYDVISGPAGGKRDWDRMRSLFVPNATLGAAFRTKKGELRRYGNTVDGYIKQSGPFLEKNGFFERELNRHVDAYANIAQVFSTYESKAKPDDAKPIERGINSFQLMFDGKRWWVVNIFWQGEDEKSPIPKNWLP